MPVRKSRWAGCRGKGYWTIGCDAFTEQRPAFSALTRGEKGRRWHRSGKEIEKIRKER